MTKPEKKVPQMSMMPEETDSIAELERMMKRAKREGLNKTLNKYRYDGAKKKINIIYRSNKEKVMKFEAKNRNFVVLIRSTGGYYKMFERSALFYTYDLAPRLNFRVKLKPDGDFDFKSKVGFVSVRDILKLELGLGEVKLKKIKSKNKTGNFIVFQLPYQYDEQRIDELFEKHFRKYEQFNQLVLVDDTIPVLFARLEELLKAVYENVRKMADDFTRRTFGDEMVMRTEKVTRLYLNFTNGRIERMDFLDIFAAPFIDRVVHHLLVESTIQWWEPRLQPGAYSGPEFLGVRVFRDRLLPGRRIRANYTRAVQTLVTQGKGNIAGIGSYDGHFAHQDSYRFIHELWQSVGWEYPFPKTKMEVL